MKKFLKFFAVMAVAFGLVGAFSVVSPAPPAEASTGPFGGKVSLLAKSTGNLQAAGGLDRNGNLYRPIIWLAPGQNSNMFLANDDADGLRAPVNCKTRVYYGYGEYLNLTPGRVLKIGDFTKVSVWVRDCR